MDNINNTNSRPKQTVAGSSSNNALLSSRIEDISNRLDNSLSQNPTVNRFRQYLPDTSKARSNVTYSDEQIYEILQQQNLKHLLPQIQKIQQGGVIEELLFTQEMTEYFENLWENIGFKESDYTSTQTDIFDTSEVLAIINPSNNKNQHQEIENIIQNNQQDLENFDIDKDMLDALQGICHGDVNFFLTMLQDTITVKQGNGQELINNIRNQLDKNLEEYTNNLVNKHINLTDEDIVDSLENVQLKELITELIQSPSKQIEKLGKSIELLGDKNSHNIKEIDLSENAHVMLGLQKTANRAINTLSRMGGDEDLTPFTTLDQITDEDVNDNAPNDKDIDNINQAIMIGAFTGLERLRTSGAYIPNILQSGQIPNLTNLDLSEVNIDFKAMQSIKNALAFGQMSSLKGLNLSHNPLGKKGFIILLDILKEKMLNNLVSLSVDKCELNQKCLKKFTHFLNSGVVIHNLIEISMLYWTNSKKWT